MAKKNADIVSPLRVGNNVLIRTVTFFHTGRIEAISEHEILLSSAAWIADTGRFSEALKKGTLNEVEPFADGIVSINRGGVIDVANWVSSLPLDVK